MQVLKNVGGYVRWVVPIRLAQLALDVVSRPRVFAPWLEPTSRALGEERDRFASDEGCHRHLVACPSRPPPAPTAGGHRWAAFRGPLGPTGRYPRTTHKML